MTSQQTDLLNGTWLQTKSENMEEVWFLSFMSLIKCRFYPQWATRGPCAKSPQQCPSRCALTTRIAIAAWRPNFAQFWNQPKWNYRSIMPSANAVSPVASFTRFRRLRWAIRVRFAFDFEINSRPSKNFNGTLVKQLSITLLFELLTLQIFDLINFWVHNWPRLKVIKLWHMWRIWRRLVFRSTFKTHTCETAIN